MNFADPNGEFALIYAMLYKITLSYSLYTLQMTINLKCLAIWRNAFLSGDGSREEYDAAHREFINEAMVGAAIWLIGVPILRFIKLPVFGRAGKSAKASWNGLRSYRHGGKMTAIEHINYRHAFNSGFKGVSKFSKGTSAKNIKNYVSQALERGTWKNATTVELNLGKTIGTNAAGGAASSIRVHVRDGLIQTAFPY